MNQGQTPGLELGRDEVHLWLARCDEIVAPALLARYSQLMSEVEIERQQRYRFERDRHRDLIARALVRTTLSRYAPIQAADWRFHKGGHGKPEIEAPPLPLRFNLSHSKELVVCAVALRHDVGVDVEYTDRRNDVLTIAKHYFSPREIEGLFALPEQHQREAFFDYWTLKEAYIKARGEGISLGLSKFSFLLQQPIAISFVPGFDDDAAHWQFKLYQPQTDYRLALAWRQGQARLARVRSFDVIPMQGYTETSQSLSSKLI